MFTVSLPVMLPPERSFFHDNQVAVPLLEGKFSLTCDPHQLDFPTLLRISGFESEEEAKKFIQSVIHSLRWASTERGFSISPSTADVATTTEKLFDGSAPVVFSSILNSQAYRAKATVLHGEHIYHLANVLNDALARDIPKKLQADKQLRLAFELFADVEFVGGTNARFVVLTTVLESLVPKGTSKKGKRGAVVGLVKATLTKAGHKDPKAVGKEVDNLYMARNNLIHDGVPVSKAQFDSLRTIVRDVLKVLVD